MSVQGSFNGQPIRHESPSMMQQAAALDEQFCRPRVILDAYGQTTDSTVGAFPPERVAPRFHVEPETFRRVDVAIGDRYIARAQTSNARQPPSKPPSQTTRTRASRRQTHSVLTRLRLVTRSLTASQVLIIAP